MFKIALLFLTIVDVYHQNYWQDFLRGNDGRYSLYVHSKFPMPSDSFFKRYELPIRVPTKWEHVMRAQIELLRQALKDPKNMRFIFLSESTLPLQNFDTVYNTVISNKKSLFPHCRNPHQYSSPAQRDYQSKAHAGTFWGSHSYNPSRILHGIPSHLQYKNHSWIILNRKHAQLMVDDKKYLDTITKAIIDNEHYPSTFLALKGLLNEVDNYQATYDDWAIPGPSSPFVFTDLTQEGQLRPLILAIQGGLYGNPRPYLFGRKFAKGCNLAPLDYYLSYRKNCRINDSSDNELIVD